MSYLFSLAGLALQSNGALFAQPGFGHHVGNKSRASSNKPQPPQLIEIFLQPGEHYFGDRETRIRTVLGSCVSMTFWHAGLLVGGMCHFMLPSRTLERRSVSLECVDGRYADEAIALVLQEIFAVGASYREFEVKLFGGGNMFPDQQYEDQHIGLKNIKAARNLVKQHGLNCVAEHLGGDGHRNVIFDVWSGDVWVRQCDVMPPATKVETSGKVDRRIS